MGRVGEASLKPEMKRMKELMDDVSSESTEKRNMTDMGTGKQWR